MACHCFRTRTGFGGHINFHFIGYLTQTTAPPTSQPHSIVVGFSPLNSLLDPPADRRFHNGLMNPAFNVAASAATAAFRAAGAARACADAGSPLAA